MSLKKTALILAALLLITGMLRLGFWQLDRAAQKQIILSAKQDQGQQPEVELKKLLKESLTSESELFSSRFRQVSVAGEYEEGKTVFVDNQVFDSKVGYLVFTPLKLIDSDQFVLVNRGWVSAGDSREVLPSILTTSSEVTLSGRLNQPPQQPPLWSDEYPVSNGKVWQFLPIDKIADQMGLKFLPMVVELAPETLPDVEVQFKRRWALVDDKWVGKHKAYALQWFAMALAFFIACCVLMVRSKKTT